MQESDLQNLAKAQCRLVLNVLLIAHNYRPQRSWGKVMFLQASVILLTGGRWGVCLSACWDSRPPCSRPPREQAPPRADPPPPPRSRHPPGTEHAGGYGQRAGGTHPTGMQTCLSRTVYEAELCDRY